VQFYIAGQEYSIAVGELPGRKYGHNWRNLQQDLGIIVFCNNETEGQG
jgi:hypothetical protein